MKFNSLKNTTKYFGVIVVKCKHRINPLNLNSIYITQSFVEYLYHVWNAFGSQVRFCDLANKCTPLRNNIQFKRVRIKCMCLFGVGKAGFVTFLLLFCYSLWLFHNKSSLLTNFHFIYGVVHLCLFYIITLQF